MVYLQSLDSPEDRAKLEQLYRSWRGLMLHAANDILHDWQDAEDAVHNAFLAIAGNLEKIADPEDRRAKLFVLTVVQHKAIDLYRMKQRRPAGELPEELTGPPVEYHGENGLTRCLLKLPLRYRSFLLLKYDLGFTNRELSRILGLSAPAVRKLDQRARDRLEALCREEGVL